MIANNILRLSNWMLRPGLWLWAKGMAPLMAAALVRSSRRLWVLGQTMITGDRERARFDEQVAFDRYMHRMRMELAGLTDGDADV